MAAKRRAANGGLATNDNGVLRSWLDASRDRSDAVVFFWAARQAPFAPTGGDGR
jgi:hypothetical protein